MALSPALLKKLVQIPIFQGLSQAEAAEFFELALESTAFKDATLFREGDEGEALLVVLEGEVLVARRGVELARVGAHAVLGEMSLVGTGDTRSATATALTDLKLLTIPSTRVKKLLKGDNLGALKVVANLAQVLSRRLALINEKFVDSRAPKGRQREELADFGKILNRWSF